jgi:hypothetical protein
MGDMDFKVTVKSPDGTEVCKLTCYPFEWSDDLAEWLQVPAKQDLGDVRWMVKCDFPPKGSTVPLSKGITYTIEVEDGREGKAEYIREELQLPDQGVPEEWLPRFLVLLGRGSLQKQELLGTR